MVLIVVIVASCTKGSPPNESATMTVGRVATTVSAPNGSGDLCTLLKVLLSDDSSPLDLQQLVDAARKAESQAPPELTNQLKTVATRLEVVRDAVARGDTGATSRLQSDRELVAALLIVDSWHRQHC